MTCICIFGGFRSNGWRTLLGISMASDEYEHEE